MRVVSHLKVCPCSADCWAFPYELSCVLVPFWGGLLVLPLAFYPCIYFSGRDSSNGLPQPCFGRSCLSLPWPQAPAETIQRGPPKWAPSKGIITISTIHLHYVKHFVYFNPFNLQKNPLTYSWSYSHLEVWQLSTEKVFSKSCPMKWWSTTLNLESRHSRILFPRLFINIYHLYDIYNMYLII